MPSQTTRPQRRRLPHLYSRTSATRTRTPYRRRSAFPCLSLLTMRRAGIILAGYDPQNGGQVYSIPLGGSLHKQQYAIGGSGSTYIYGYCDANWKEDMTEEEGISFVKS